jgi:hypothetical protein
LHRSAYRSCGYITLGLDDNVQGRQRLKVLQQFDLKACKVVSPLARRPDLSPKTDKTLSFLQMWPPPPAHTGISLHANVN